MQESHSIIDGMGSAALLPAAQVPPPAYNGVPWLDRALAAGLTAMNVTMGIRGVAQGADDFRAYLHSVHGYLSYFELEPRLLHVLRASDITRAKAEGRLGIIFGCQGLASKLDGDPSLILIMARLGQRIMQLAYNERDALGCGCLEPEDSGLTEFGRVCIREIDDARMVVDLAHAGPRTAREAIEFARRTPVITHANVRALLPLVTSAEDVEQCAGRCAGRFGCAWRGDRHHRLCAVQREGAGAAADFGRHDRSHCLCRR